MQKKYFGFAAAAIAVLGLGLVIAKTVGLKSHQQDEIIWAGPIKLKYNPDLKPGVIASLNGREVLESDLITQSKLLEELGGVESQLILDAIEKKMGGKFQAGNKIEIYRPIPSANFVAKITGSDGVIVVFSPRRSDSILARVNGDPVTRKTLSLNQIRFSQVQQAQMDEYLNLLKGIFMRQLLLHKAKEAGTDIEGLITSNIIKTDLPVSEEEIDRFALENGIGNATDKMIRPRLKAIMIDRRRTAAVDEYAKVNFATAVGEISVKGPDYAIPLTEKLALIDQQKAGSTATVIYVFGNLLCSSCAQFISDLTALRDDTKGAVRIGFVHTFPDGDWKSRLVAESAECLSAQKYDYFWKFATQAAREGEAIDEKRIYELVKLAGADFPQFQTCLLKQTYKQTVEEKLKYASDVGVTSVPTVIIGEHILSGVISRSKITEAIRDQATKNEAGFGSWFRRKN